MKNIRYLRMENMEAGAVVAGLGIRYLFTRHAPLTLNHKDDMVKVSARGNKPLISGAGPLPGPEKGGRGCGGSGRGAHHCQRRIHPSRHQRIGSWPWWTRLWESS